MKLNYEEAVIHLKNSLNQLFYQLNLHNFCKFSKYNKEINFLFNMNYVYVEIKNY